MHRKTAFAELAAFASIGAGIVHAQAVGMHAEHVSAARTFIVLAILQSGVGIAALVGRTNAWTRLGLVAVNSSAIVGWLLTRTSGISWINGLETPESPQAADVLCALLALVSVIAVMIPSMSRRLSGWTSQPTLMAFAAAVLVVPAMWTGAGHVHSHSEGPTESAFTIDASGVIIATTSTTVESSTTVVSPDSTGAPGTSAGPTSTHATRRTTTTMPTTTTTAASHSHTTTPEQRLAAASGWPRPFDPTAGPDFDGVGGVTPVQFQRARAIIESTARDLAQFANPADAVAAGYRSIGDSVTGYEHFVKWSLIADGRVLDSAAPESLVYRISGGTKKLVSAMYIAQPGTDINDPTLVDYAGPLMQWHIHSNLCWRTNASGDQVVSGITDANGNCLIGSPRSGVTSPMVHVWVAAHPCGPFAAVEGVAAGIAQASDSERLDLCSRH